MYQASKVNRCSTFLRVQSWYVVYYMYNVCICNTFDSDWSSDLSKATQLDYLPTMSQHLYPALLALKGQLEQVYSAGYIVVLHVPVCSYYKKRSKEPDVYM